MKQYPFQSIMHPLYAFTLCYFFACLSLDAGETENPLDGSLRDPWGIISGAKTNGPKKRPIDGSQNRGLSPASPLLPTATEPTTATFGPSFESFQSRYESHLDLSVFEKTGQDSPAARYDRGLKEWDQFQPTGTVFPPGAIFYGDPSALVTNVSFPDTSTPTTRWPVVPFYTVAFTSLLLIGAYFRVRYRGRYTRDR